MMCVRCQYSCSIRCGNRYLVFLFSVHLFLEIIHGLCADDVLSEIKQNLYVCLLHILFLDGNVIEIILGYRNEK